MSNKPPKASGSNPTPRNDSGTSEPTGGTAGPSQSGSSPSSHWERIRSGVTKTAGQSDDSYDIKQLLKAREELVTSELRTQIDGIETYLQKERDGKSDSGNFAANIAYLTSRNDRQKDIKITLSKYKTCLNTLVDKMSLLISPHELDDSHAEYVDRENFKFFKEIMHLTRALHYVDGSVNANKILSEDRASPRWGAAATLFDEAEKASKEPAKIQWHLLERFGLKAGPFWETIKDVKLDD